MSDGRFSHLPVMRAECIKALAVRPDGVYLDGTAGGGGHSAAIAERLTTGRLIAIDRDPDAVQAAGQRLSSYPQATVVQGEFASLEQILDRLGVGQVDGILFDLGVSSHQLDAPERGFSYRADAPLDMRMSQSGMTAAELLAALPEEELSRILWEYGEERFSRQIARRIVSAREEKPILTTGELAGLIYSAVPAKARREKNPCKRSFQAIRIAVNGELTQLSEGLDAAFRRLAAGGRLAVLTFHSLEDRMVKQRFAAWCRGCVCPPDCPVCICGQKPQAKPITKKPVTASPEELEENHRSHSAKLRVVERLEDEQKGQENAE